MRAEVVAMTGENLDMDAIKKAGDILKAGGLVAFPTETVYGLGGNALDPQASMKIYAAKGRPSDNPLIVHIAELSKLADITTEIPEGAKILAEKYWPGPLTMILPKADIVPKETTGGLDSVAVRFPSDKIAQELIKAGGGFVAAPSANTSGRPSPTMAEHVEEDLGDAIDMIIDGGQVGIGWSQRSLILQKMFRLFCVRDIFTGDASGNSWRCSNGQRASDHRQQCASKGSGNEVSSLCA